MAGKRPTNWPADVNYVTDFVYDRRMPRAQFAQRSIKPLVAASKYTKIKLITDPQHPACGQRGLVAACLIPKRTHIVDYLGFVTTDALCSRTSEYSLRLTGDLSGPVAFSGWPLPRLIFTAVDAEKFGNEARFVNDFRGTGAPRPNVEFCLREEPGCNPVMAIFSLQHDIPKGTELLISYGKGFWRDFQAQREQAAGVAGEVLGADEQETQETAPAS